ncbi:MAG: anti-sigma factor antagonist [Planctomycetaceae bacterium]|nr:MAG: anti-sigma factor antagonist [Planctomycetaceae bacterium]
MSHSGLLVNEFYGTTVVTFQDSLILDGVVVDAIGQELYELVDKKAKRKIILDFTTVKSLSSSLIGVIITLQRKSAAINGRVILCGVRDELMKVFKIVSLDKILMFAKNEDAAMSVLSVGASK